MDAWIDEFYTLAEEYRGVAERLQGVQHSANDQVTWNIADWTVTEQIVDMLD